ncbi:MAG TPA: DUF2663 family protein [Virgibacillus sp.]|nr:DUF2663 family protein [Virgibacillus sp.]
MSSWREQVSDDTKVILDKLCELNEEQKTLDKKHSLFFAIFLGSALLLFIYALSFIFFITDANLLKAVINFFKHIIHIVLIIIPLALFFVQLYFQSKYSTALDQFEQLRLETIDFLKSSWLKDEHTTIRDEISKEMMDSHGINIRFKTVF